ncbi:undecaprenyl-diphosphatase [Candidatus Photodesmus katoptron]|uniref:Undecaprenyl-diphosphatase n=1 Tax=Candidatus Photodesmus katoptron Akat1 TaxID=1236703 RepID=S3DJ86_9GAMM|nr:undecaprenyl-diphosphate phosphatase [Candidatus Photodesmus katoptron]EPE37755.1 undecaprenyl-diphosphatase [Candidatus Photodesmus katoptron Akat1]KEY90523.1 undecaprenyl-diphosphatase [Candidatus Photodesmus katoptron]
MDYIEVFFLALIQGVTEFLPISSSAHLILPSVIFSWENPGLFFSLAVHAGTLLAIIVYFRKELSTLLSFCLHAILNGKSNKESQLVLMILLSVIPTCVFALCIKGILELYLYDPWIIVSTTITFGLLLWYADVNATLVNDEYSIDWKKSLFIGIAQAIAIIPGTSRSGITITAALHLGLTRKAAIRFSFLMSIPIIILASVYLCLGLIRNPETIFIDLLLIGVIVSFVSSYICIHFFLKLISHISMVVFSVYRLIFGSSLLLFLLLN